MTLDIIVNNIKSEKLLTCFLENFSSFYQFSHFMIVIRFCQHTNYILKRNSMDEFDEARQSLLVYLQANRTFIDEKIYNEFNVECIQGQKLQSLNIDKMCKTIKEIFDFGDNPVYYYFFAKLKDNIQQYIRIQYSTKAIPSFFDLDIDKLIDVVKYCIIHGFDENAKKAMKEQPKITKKQAPKDINIQKDVTPPKPKQKQKVVFIEEVKKIEPPKDEFAHVKSKLSTFLQRDKIPQKKQFKIEKYSMPELNVMPRYMLALQKTLVIKQEEQDSRVIVPALDDGYLIAHRKTLRERLEKLFNFYCCQQQSLGQGPTFDRMKDQGQLMNLGKFMQFCQYTKIFNIKQISKDMLIAEYKRISQGKTQISFEIFEKIISKLDQKYIQIMSKDAANTPVPTFQARLMLNQPAKLGQLKKHRNLVFGTRSKQSREVKEWSQSNRYPKKQLTGHSGRFVNDLSIDIKQRPEPSKSQRKPKATNLSDATIHLNDLKKLKLPKISWLVEQEQEQIPVRPRKKS